MNTIERIIALLDKNNISAAKMMRELGFSSGLFSQWKSGKQKPSADKLAKIAEYLHTTTDYLLGSQIPANIKSTEFSFVEAPINFVPVPVIGNVAAGTHCLAQMDIVEYIPCDASLIKDGYDYCYLNVHGDSMEPLIQERDLVLVRIQDIVDSGSYAVVLVDDEDGLVKRVEYDKEQLTLISENPYYPPRRFVREEMNRVRIFGLVIETRRKFI